MTKAPAIATLDTVFVGRIYRDGKLQREQPGTLTELAAYCARNGQTMDICIGDGEPLGHLFVHGRMLWYGDAEHCASGMHKAGECPARSPSLCTGTKTGSAS